MNVIALSHLSEHATALLSCCTTMITFKSLQMARLSLRFERLRDIFAEPPTEANIRPDVQSKIIKALKVLICAYHVITSNQPLNATFSPRLQAASLTA